MPTIAAIQDAQQRIRTTARTTPCVPSDYLSKVTGARVWLKLENRQLTGSFKVRGALNKLAQLSAAERRAGVVAASAGNHAQAVAYAARCHDLRAVIVMPETAPLTKVRGTYDHGAQVVLHGANFEEAYSRAHELAQAHGYTLIHAFDDPAVIAGQGTIGLELLEQVPDLDTVVVPVGGGGLIAGIAVALKATRPQIEVIGVEAERMAAMQASLAAGSVQRLRPASTIADGICIAAVAEQTLALVREHVSRITTCTEDQIANAVMALLEREKLLAEGAGAAGVAALLNGPLAVSGKTVALIISGGNMDMSQLAVILERGLEADGRLARLLVVAPDRADSIAVLASLAADHHANIVEINENRHLGEVEMGEVEIELTLETRGHGHLHELRDAIRARGFAVRGTSPGAAPGYNT